MEKRGSELGEDGGQLVRKMIGGQQAIGICLADREFGYRLADTKLYIWMTIDGQRDTEEGFFESVNAQMVIFETYLHVLRKKNYWQIY